ncbi:flagellar protein FlaG [candidate division KSB1 bacterium]
MAPEELRITSGDLQVKTPQQAPPASATPAQSDAARAPKQNPDIQLQRKLDPSLLEKIAEELNNDFRIFNTALSFSVDDKTGTTVIKILDRETEKIIREIPPDELLRIAAKLTEIIGRIVDELA